MPEKFGIDIEAESILVIVPKIIGTGICGHHDEDDPYIYDYNNIKLTFNGSEFIGDHEHLFELSKVSEPANFNINCVNLRQNRLYQP